MGFLLSALNVLKTFYLVVIEIAHYNYIKFDFLFKYDKLNMYYNMYYNVGSVRVNIIKLPIKW